VKPYLVPVVFGDQVYVGNRVSVYWVAVGKCVEYLFVFVFKRVKVLRGNGSVWCGLLRVVLVYVRNDTSLKQ